MRLEQSPKVCKGTERLRNQRTIRDHPGYGLIKIGQNAEKNPEDLRRLAVTQTPVKEHQLTLVLKKLSMGKIIIIMLGRIVWRVLEYCGDLSLYLKRKYKG